MLAALAREHEARRQAQAQAQADQLTVAGYVDVIGGLVENQWNRPPSARNGMYVVLRIRLTPTGEVISITRIAGNGNEAFDRSAKQAIDKAAPFREIQGMESRIFEQNFREFRFEFRPEDLLE
nr:cell envelope integrity protein TolA [Sansalvadorimonas sp. 2012CJ34-2]